MNKKAKILFGAGMLGTIGITAWTLSTLPQMPEEDILENLPIMTYEGNVFKEEKDGRVVWEMTAQQIDINANIKEAQLTTISATLYSSDGSRKANLLADKGTYNMQANKVSVCGNVQVENSDGTKLQAGEISWGAEDSLLIADKNVIVTKDDMLLTAERVESLDAFNRIKAIGSVYFYKGADERKRTISNSL